MDFPVCVCGNYRDVECMAWVSLFSRETDYDAEPAHDADSGMGYWCPDCDIDSFGFDRFFWFSETDSFFRYFRLWGGLTNA